MAARVQLPAAAVGTVSPQAPSWGSATGNGRLLLAAVAVRYTSTVGTINPPSDWVLIPGTELAGAARLHIALYYIKNAASRSGAESFSYSQPVDAMYVSIAEYSGLATGAVLDRHISHDGGGAQNANPQTGTTPATQTASQVFFGITAIDENHVTTTTVMGGSATGGTAAKYNDNGVGSIFGARVYDYISTAAGTAEFEGHLSSAAHFVGAIATLSATNLPGVASTLTHSATAVIFGSPVRTHTATAVILAPANVRTHTVTAVIKKTVGGAPGLFDAVPGLTVPALVVPGLPLLPGTGLNHRVDATIRGVVVRQHQVDAVIEKTASRSHTVDAVIEATATRTHTVEAVVRKTATVSHTAAALILKPTTLTHTATAFVVGRHAITHQVDAEIIPGLTQHGREHDVDALIEQTASRTHTATALILKSTTPTHTADAVIRATQTKTHTVDAFVIPVLTHTVDAVVLAVQLRTHDVDGSVVLRPVVEHTVNAYLVNRRALTHTVDANIQAVGDRIANQFPDAELLVTTILRNGDWSGFAQVPQIGTRVPSVADFDRGVIRVERIGGRVIDRRRFDAPHMTLSVWNVEESTAERMAARARRIIMDVEGSRWELAIKPDAWVSGVDDMLPPTKSFDPLSQQPRYIFDVTLYVHAV